MGITFIAANSSVSAASTAVNVVRPAGTTTGDLLVAQVFVEDNTDRVTTVPSGWTTAVNRTIGARAIRQYVYYKVLSSAEPSTYTWGINASDEIIGMIAAYRGADSTTPIGNIGLSTVNAQSSLVTAPSITVQNSSNLVIVAGGNAFGDSWTPPSTAGAFTERVDTRTGAGASNISAFIADLVFTSTGASGSQVSNSVNPDYYLASQVEVIAFIELVSVTVSDCSNVQTAGSVVLTEIIIDESVSFKDADVKLADGDVYFYPHLNELTVSDCYSINVSDEVSFGQTILPNSAFNITVSSIVVLEQEHTLAVSNTLGYNITQDVMLNIETGIEPEPVWFDTETAIFKDHPDGQWTPHAVTLLEVSNCIQENEPEEIIFGEFYSLAVSSAYSKNVADALNLSEAVTLTLGNVYDSQVTDAVVLLQIHTLTVSDVYDSNVTGSIVLFTESVLTLSDVIQYNVSDTVLISVEGFEYVPIADAVQNNYADAIGLYQEYVLTVSDSYDANASDTVSLAPLDQVTVENAYSKQVADSVTLSELNNIVLANVVNSNVSDVVQLSEQQQIAFTDAIVEIYTQEPILNLESEHTLEIVNSIDEQFVESLLLYQEYVATQLDSLQGNYADLIRLSVEGELLISDAVMNNYAQSIVLGFRDGFLGIVINPYLVSMTHLMSLNSMTRDLHSVSKTPHRTLMQ
jgi:uncharacterized protein YsxB (DUF464 family)